MPKVYIQPKGIWVNFPDSWSEEQITSGARGITSGNIEIPEAPPSRPAAPPVVTKPAEPGILEKAGAALSSLASSASEKLKGIDFGPGEADLYNFSANPRDIEDATGFNPDRALESDIRTARAMASDAFQGVKQATAATSMAVHAAYRQPLEWLLGGFEKLTRPQMDAEMNLGKESTAHKAINFPLEMLKKGEQGAAAQLDLPDPAKQFIANTAGMLGSMVMPVGPSIAMGRAGMQALPKIATKLGASEAVAQQLAARPFFESLGAGLGAAVVTNKLDVTDPDFPKTAAAFMLFEAAPHAGKVAKEKGRAAYEKATRTTLDEGEVPPAVYVSAEKIWDLHGNAEKITPEEAQMVKDLGLTGPEYRKAAKSGLTIRIPSEKIITYGDRPWVQTIKKVFGKDPFIETRKVKDPGSYEFGPEPETVVVKPKTRTEQPSEPKETALLEGPRKQGEPQSAFEETASDGYSVTSLLRVQRIEEPGVETSFDKPQELYTTPSDVESPHADLGGEKTIYGIKHDAKILDIPEYDSNVAMRKGAISAGSGTQEVTPPNSSAGEPSPMTGEPPSEKSPLSKALSRKSADTIERGYMDGKIPYQDALDALAEKDRQISEKPENQLKGQFNLYTPKAKKKLDEIGWSIQRILALEKKTKSSSPEIVTDSDQVKKIKKSIAEGEMSIRTGKDASGKRLDTALLEALQRSVDKAKAKIGMLPERTTSTMSEAISMSSPNGNVSGRARASSSERLRRELFGENGLRQELPVQPSEVESLRATAKQLRDLAKGKMKPRAYLKRAAMLEAKANDIEGGNKINPASSLADAPKNKTPVSSLKIGDRFIHPNGEVYEVIAPPKGSTKGKVYIQDGKKKVLDPGDKVNHLGNINDPRLSFSGGKYHGDKPFEEDQSSENQNVAPLDKLPPDQAQAELDRRAQEANAVTLSFLGTGALSDLGKTLADAAGDFKPIRKLLHNLGIKDQHDGLVITSSDYRDIYKYLQMPHDVAIQHPEFKPLYDRQVARELSKAILDHSFAKMTEPYFNGSGADRAKVDKALIGGEQQGIRELDPLTLKDVYGLDDNQVKMYLAIRDALDGAAELLISEMEDVGVSKETIEEFKGRLAGYIPHKWYGNWAVIVRKPGGKKTVFMSKTGYTDRFKERDRLQQLYPNHEVFILQSKKIPYEAYQDAAPWAVSKMVDLVIEKADTDPGTADELKQALADLYKSKGFGQNFIKRKNVPGWTEDLARPLAEYFSGFNGYISKMKAIKGFAEDIKAIDPKKKPNLYRYALDYIRYVTGEQMEFGAAKRLAYVYYLYGNLKSAAVNLTQNLLLGWPVLSKHTGLSGPIILQAQARAANRRLLSEGEKAFVQELEDIGFLDPKLAVEMSAFTSNPLIRGISGKIEKVAEAFDIFQHFESWNRRAMAVACYDAGIRDPWKAAELIEEAHFRYAKGNRPHLMRGPISPLMTFRSWAINYITWCKNEAKAGRFGALSRSALAMLLLGGLSAIPGYNLIKKAYIKAFGEDPWTSSARTIGDGAAELAFRGLPSKLGVSFTGSIGMGDILPIDLEGAGGVFADVPVRVSKVTKDLSARDYTRALEDASPEAIRQPMAAWRTYSKGDTTRSGAPIYDPTTGKQKQLTGGEALVKALGFQPARSAQSWDLQETMQQIEDARTARKQTWANRYVVSMGKGDKKEAAEVLREITAYNKDMKEAGRPEDQITKEEMMSAVIARKKSGVPPKYMRPKWHKLLEGRGMLPNQ